ncbi:S1C family serine protease [Acetatifactor muris]|uniref:S1C family serine protease n=1 Tax=Acetatifactor muris TaxID=879566 RepID=UPI0023F1A888|nr:trypsin-like peptidase domain-containing protein [Acetatifactor muris]
MYENEIYSDSNTGKYTTYQTDGNFYTGNAAPGSADAAGTAAKGKKKKGVFGKFMLSLSLGLVFGLFAGAGFYAVQLGADRLMPQESRNEISSENGTQTPASGNAISNVSQVTYVSDDISDVVEEVMPAMVSIVNTSTRTGSFWGYTYTESVPSAGSGIIVEERDNELLIVTNNHVVAGADSLEVTFIDGSAAQASIKGLDAEMDLAVIAVAVDSLSAETRNAITTARLGDSDSLKLGMPVIAIGNALGIGQSVTNGIVSALDREVTSEDGTKGTFIQTNAAINGGNSGGALLTITGEVIGINSGKIKEYGVEGMGYAIPISKASPIIADLMERRTRTEKVAEEEKGYMGISPQEVSAQMEQIYGIPQGVYVVSVEEGSPAEAAGMKNKDVIVKFDGQRISSYADLQEALEYYKTGDTVTVTVKRAVNGEYESYDLELTLGVRTAE